MPDYTRHDELVSEITRLKRKCIAFENTNKIGGYPPEQFAELQIDQQRTITDLAIAEARLEAERGRLIQEALNADNPPNIRRAPKSLREQAQDELAREHPSWKYVTENDLQEKMEEIVNRQPAFPKPPLEGFHSNWQTCPCTSCEQLQQWYNVTGGPFTDDLWKKAFEQARTEYPAWSRLGDHVDLHILNKQIAKRAQEIHEGWIKEKSQK
jgi:hypothetical protein